MLDIGGQDNCMGLDGPAHLFLLQALSGSPLKRTAKGGGRTSNAKGGGRTSRFANGQLNHEQGQEGDEAVRTRHYAATVAAGSPLNALGPLQPKATDKMGGHIRGPARCGPGFETLQKDGEAPVGDLLKRWGGVAPDLPRKFPA